MSDGNFHDKDDIGAITMIEAIVWRANAQNSLVHLSHSNHLGANDNGQHFDMVNSAERALSRYIIDESSVFDCQQDLAGASIHLATQINLSSATDELVILQGGPWESMAQAFDISNPLKHRHVTIVSHNGWNDFHKHNSNHRNKDNFYFQYGTAGKWAGLTPPTFVQIFDGNNTAFKSNLQDWNWLNNGPVQTWFVYSRTAASDYAVGDMSDAVMVYWLLTGNDKPNMQELRNFFGL